MAGIDKIRITPLLSSTASGYIYSVWGQKCKLTVLTVDGPTKFDEFVSAFVASFYGILGEISLLKILYTAMLPFQYKSHRN